MGRLLYMMSGIMMIQAVQAQTYMGPTSLENQTLQHARVLGPTTLKDIRADVLSVTGVLTFENLSVKEDTTVIGPVEGTKGTFGSLNVTGPLAVDHGQCTQLYVVGEMTLSDFKVLGPSVIVGTLMADKSTFQDMTITADEITLLNSKANNILVRKDGRSKKQVLQLKGKTQVRGKIIFESGIGIIEKDKGAQIQGDITGAQVEEK